jgi:hypothetical protein
MICSSVNRFFMELSLPVKGRELTSQMATRSVSGHPCRENAGNKPRELDLPVSNLPFHITSPECMSGT